MLAPYVEQVSSKICPMSLGEVTAILTGWRVYKVLREKEPGWNWVAQRGTATIAAPDGEGLIQAAWDHERNMFLYNRGK
jgi:hypothetical protein